MTAQELSNKYFMEFKLSRLANVSLALEDHRRWTSMSVADLLGCTLEKQAEFADYVAKKMVQHKQPIIREFAMTAVHGAEKCDRFRTQSSVGNFALVMLSLDECREKRELARVYEQLKYKTVGSFWSNCIELLAAYLTYTFGFMLMSLILAQLRK